MKGKKYPKIFYKLSRNNVSLTKQIIKLKNPGGVVINTDVMCMV